MIFIIDIKENKNIFNLPYPYIYEGRKGYIVIDYKGDVIFVCNEYTRNVEHLFDNGTVIDNGGGVIVNPPDPDPNPDPDPDPVIPDELVIGTWTTASGIIFPLILKKTGDKRFFLQTDVARTFYLERGLNFLTAQSASIAYSIVDFDIADYTLHNESVTLENGFKPSSINGAKSSVSWNTSWWITEGYVQNEIGEWVLADSVPQNVNIPLSKTAYKNETLTITINSLADITVTILTQPSKGGLTYSNKTISYFPSIIGVDNFSYKVINVGSTNSTTYIVTANVLLREDDGPVDPPPPVDGSRIQGFIPFNLNGDYVNKIKWEEFQDVTLPAQHYSTLGWGIQMWSNEPVGSNGKLKALTVGHTNIAHLSLFNKALWEAKNIYYFNQLSYIVAEGARNMVRDNQWKSVWGNATGLYVQDGNSVSAGGNESFVDISREGAIELGKRIHYHSSAEIDRETGQWSIPTSNAWITLDEEYYNVYGAHAARLMQFLGWLNKGYRLEAPNKLISWYGRPTTWWLHANRSNASDAEIESELWKNSFFNTEGFNDGCMIDIPGGYLKVPYITGANIYKKDSNGNFLIQNGKRVFRDDTYSIIHFGFENPIVPRPSDYFVANTNWASNPNNWVVESKLFLENIYGYANRTIFGLAGINRDEFSNNDISIYKPTAKKLGCAVVRPRTEPWTPGGNYEWSREIGMDGIFFMVMFPYLSGCRGVELWDNGEWQSEGNFKERGQNHFVDPDHVSNRNRVHGQWNPDKDWTHMMCWTAAMQTFAFAMQGTNPTNWKYIRFYYPVKGEQQSECISTGIYVGNKFKFIILNPSLEEGEILNVTLKAGNYSTSIELVGRKVYFYDIEVPVNLNPVDFKLQYTNIYNQLIKVNGTLNTIANHYE